MLEYKIEILEELKRHGFTTYRIRQEKRLSESQLANIRAGKVLSASGLDALCTMTGKQPGQLIAWKPDPIPAAAAAEQKTE